MKFHFRDKIGKSGERFLETFVEEELAFTYRKVGHPDIGVDGEIETLDAKRNSTGGFLKVQVKTTEESYGNSPVKIALDEKHLDYFSLLTVLPILVAISLKDQTILWKPILGKDNYRGPRGGIWRFVQPANRSVNPIKQHVDQIDGRAFERDNR